MRYAGRSWRAFQPRGAGAATARLEACEGRVLGLDPGSQRTGFGVIDCVGGRERYVVSGCIDVRGRDMIARLQRIYSDVSTLVRQHQPDIVAIERVFMHRNPDSALKLGQARGAALCAIPREVPVFEYAPRAIKLAVVGSGNAEKFQVAHMIRALLSLSESPGADAADALAVAVCHAHARRVRVLAQGGGVQSLQA